MFSVIFAIVFLLTYLYLHSSGLFQMGKHLMFDSEVTQRDHIHDAPSTVALTHSNPISHNIIELADQSNRNLHKRPGSRRVLAVQFAFVTRRPYCPGRPKKLCFTTPSLTPMVSTARLGVVKQSSFGLPGQYGRRVTRANGPSIQQV